MDIRHSLLAVAAGLAGVLALGCGHGQAGPATLVVAAAPGDLDAAVQSQAAAQAPGATKVGELLRGTAAGKGGRTEFHLQLDEGHCYWFSAVGGPGVGNLALYLWGASYFRVASVAASAPQAVLMHCPKSTGMYRLQARMRRGAGDFVVGVYAKAGPPKPEPTLESLIEAEAAALAPGAARIGAFLEGEAGRNQWPMRLEAGTCYWWVAQGDKSINEISLFLSDSKRRRVEHNKTPARKVSIAFCPRRSGLHRLELKLASGTGKYKVGLYGKVQEAPAPPPAPVMQPAAPPPAPSPVPDGPAS